MISNVQEQVEVGNNTPRRARCLSSIGVIAQLPERSMVLVARYVLRATRHRPHFLVMGRSTERRNPDDPAPHHQSVRFGQFCARSPEDLTPALPNRARDEA